MHVLVTGAFGNVGSHTVPQLSAHGHSVRCCDLDTPANRRAARRLGKGAEVVWGDLAEPDTAARAVAGVDAVVHLAAIIPPLSNQNPELAERVNVRGTANVVAAIAAQPTQPRLVFTSSVAVYGLCQDQPPPRRAGDPANPSDTYGRNKSQCERIVREELADWSILRLAAVPPLALDQVDPMMFEIRLDNRIEFVDTRDVGLALANAVSAPEARGKILLIGGGPNCQMTYGQFVNGALTSMGIGPLPAAAYGQAPFYTDWMDTTESQAILGYQRHSYERYLNDLHALLGPRRWAVRFLRPLLRRWLLSKSPYYRHRRRPAGAGAAVPG